MGYGWLRVVDNGTISKVSEGREDPNPPVTNAIRRHIGDCIRRSSERAVAEAHRRAFRFAGMVSPQIRPSLGSL